MMKEETKNEPSKAIERIQKTIADYTLSRVQELEKEGLTIPPGYSVANALKSAWLILQKSVDTNKSPVLLTCTKDSIANCLLDMVIQGLSPVKKQCYFIAYGKELTLSRSYMGTVAVTKKIKGITDVFANVIYDGDKFEFSINPLTGLKEIIRHETSFDNIDITKIRGAYAIILRDNKPAYVEVMTFAQIKRAWEQGQQKGDGKVHKNFTEEMAKKTVIGRACKMFLNTSDDSDILVNSIRNNPDIDDLPNTDYSEIESEIEENANKKEIDIQLPAAKEPEAAKTNGEPKESFFNESQRKAAKTQEAGKPPF